MTIPALMLMVSKEAVTQIQTKSAAHYSVTQRKIDDFLKTTIDEGTIAALKQIDDMKYTQELIDREVKNIIKLAIVFKGKEIKITEKN